MLQDISPSRINIVYRACTPKEDSPLLVFFGKKVLAKSQGDTWVFPKFKELDIAESSVRYLFSVDNTQYFYMESGSIALDGYSYFNARELRLLKPKKAAFALMTGCHLHIWYSKTKFCGCCGERLVHDENLRAMNCPACNNQIFPVIAPAVIVAIVNKGRILLTKYNRPNAAYALVAGFCEIGESPEDTVRREVMEETGLTVDRVMYYKSQPWGVASNMLLGFFVTITGDDTIHIDNDELSFGDWFAPEEIDFENDGVSLTREMIEAFTVNPNIIQCHERKPYEE